MRVDENDVQQAREWIEHLRATKPGEVWWENLIDALVDLKTPIIPVLTGYLRDKDHTVALGAAAAIERIARFTPSRKSGPGAPKPVAPHDQEMFQQVRHGIPKLSTEMLVEPLRILAVAKQLIQISEQGNVPYILAAIAQLQWFAGDIKAARETLQDVELLLDSIEAADTVTLSQVAKAQWLLVDYEAAKRTQQKLLDGTSTMGSGADRSVDLLAAVRFLACRQQFDRALKMLESIEDFSVRVAALQEIARIQSFSRQHVAAEETLGKAFREVATLDDGIGKARGVARMADLLADVGKPEQARTMLEQTKAMLITSHDRDNPASEAEILCAIAGTEVKLANRSAAITYIDHAQQLVSKISDGRDRDHGMWIILRALWQAGQRDRAIEIANSISHLDVRACAYIEVVQKSIKVQRSLPPGT